MAPPLFGPPRMVHRRAEPATGAKMVGMWWFLQVLAFLVACGAPDVDDVSPADPAAVLAATGMEKLETSVPLAPVLGAQTPMSGYTVQPLSFVAWPERLPAWIAPLPTAWACWPP